jgi:hypothetical protein
VRAKLVAAGVCDVTVIKAMEWSPSPATPTLAQLQQYDAIMTWSFYNYAAPVALGDVLANYVDQGGAVVQAHSFGGPSTTRLSGRWRTEFYAPFNLGFFGAGVRLTLTPTVPAHAILSGVATFNGGSDSYHYWGLAAQGGAEVIARWSAPNNEPLVAARPGPYGGRIVGLNFYPPSSTVSGGLWDSTTQGALLMVNALQYAAETPAPVAGGPTVAVLGADDDVALEGVRCRLHNEGLFTRVDKINVTATTPTVASLAQYNSVVTWSEGVYGDAAALGNVLADYVDQGGSVVQAGFVTYPASGSSVGGRWRDGGYRAFTDAPSVSASGLTLQEDAPGHVILAGVPAFTAGAGSYHHSPVALESVNKHVASWSDAQPLVAVGTDPVKRVVGLNLFPPSGNARLIANTLLFAANHLPTAVAGADQTVEATSSAMVSFTLNGSASDSDGDPLAFAWSGALSASGDTIVIDVPPPAAPSKTNTLSLTLTVTDGKGGEMTDSVTLTVTDTTGPVLHNMLSGIVSVDATSVSGVTLTNTFITATDAVDGDRPVTCVPEGAFPVGDTVVTCSSTDTRDNTTSASFTLRVLPLPDTTGPVLNNMPSGIVSIAATSTSGVYVTNTFITATDAVDGDRPVVCAPSGAFPVGDTVVTCSSADTRGNTTSASFTLRVLPLPVVTPPPPPPPPVEPPPVVPPVEIEVPGKMDGAGYVRASGTKYEFSFAVSESASGVERVRFSLHTRSGKFVASTMESCTFGDRTALFSGTGRWQGVAGYRYTVFARDYALTGQRRADLVRMTITSPAGRVVADVDGEVNGGKVNWHNVKPVVKKSK